MSPEIYVHDPDPGSAGKFVSILMSYSSHLTLLWPLFYFSVYVMDGGPLQHCVMNNACHDVDRTLLIPQELPSGK